MAHVYGYGRRSSDDQSTFSPDAQRRAVDAWCATNQHQLIAWYFDDDLSGKREDRDQFQHLLRDACADRGSIVVVHKIDRLARDTEIILNRHKRLRRAGVRLVSVMEPIDFDTPFGTVVLTQIASLGQFHVDNLAPEVTKGLREKYQQGGHNGYVPYGYRRVHQYDDIGRRIRGTERIITTDDAPTVRLMFDLYATGSYSDATLRDELRRRGLTMCNPKTGQRVPFQRDSVGGILNNRFYLGQVSFKGEWRPGSHAPLIAQDLWDAVAAIRARRLTVTGRRTIVPDSTGLLCEMGYCGVCGGRLYYITNSQNHLRYYHCGQRRKFGREACDSRMLHAVKHEALVTDLLQSLIIPREIAARALDAAEQRLAAPPTPTPTVNRAQLQRQLERLRAAYFAGDDAVSSELYARETARIKGLLAGDGHEPVRAQRIDTDRALAMLDTIGTALQAGTPLEQRALVLQLFDQVWLERHAITAIRPSGTYAALIEMAAKVTNVTSTGLEPVAFSSGG